VQLVVPVPPQSIPVSPWFFFPSWQLGASHTLRLLQVLAVQQLLLVQSPSTLQEVPAPQVLAGLIKAQLPPQSGPVSLPFCAPSPHVGTAQVFVFASQTLLWQSESERQLLPVAHRCVHVVPPQLTSVSLPFCTASKQLGASQMALELQTLLWQSWLIVQMRPSAQGEQLPPQSTSVSPGSIVLF
jgi:hypothetical protein